MKKVMVVIPALGSGGGERLAVSLIAKMNPQNISTRLVILYPYQDTENARFAMASGIDTIYLNITSISDKKDFYERFNSNYSSNVRLESYPAFIIISDKKIVDLVQKEEKKLSINDVEKLLDEYSIGTKND